MIRNTPPNTVEQIRRLIESEEVLFLVNPVGTATNMAVLKYINQKHVPHLFIGTGATVFNDPEHHPWTMSWTPHYASVQILRECGDDLTRENVMKQATDLDMELPLLLPDIRLKTSPTDLRSIKQMRLVRFDGQRCVLFGDVLASE